MPRWKELKRFCDRDGWELYKDTDHYIYRKIDDDGNIKLTKVSKDSGEIRPHMWREILKKQLHVTQEYFNSKIWKCGIRHLENSYPDAFKLLWFLKCNAVFKEQINMLGIWFLRRYAKKIKRKIKGLFIYWWFCNFVIRIWWLRQKFTKVGVVILGNERLDLSINWRFAWSE